MTRTIKRLPLGRPIPSQTANAADTVALLSGVNLGSVVKVFAALEALSSHVGLDTHLLVDIGSIPAEPPRYDGTDTKRVTATRALVETIAADRRYAHLDYILNLPARMAARSDTFTSS